MVERKALGIKHKLEKEGPGRCQGSGIGGAVACSGSSTGVLVAGAEADTDVGGGAAGVGFGQGQRFLGTAAGRDSGGRRGSLQDEACYGVGFDSRPAAAASAAGRSAAAEAERGRDLLELETAASLQSEGVGGEEARRRWQWQKGLRRLVDRDSPSVSNEQQNRVVGECRWCGKGPKLPPELSRHGARRQEQCLVHPFLARH